MNDVKVHYNSAKPAQLQALAYTQGTDIHVGPGQERHLPHEAWHVVQQKQGRVKPTMQARGIALNAEQGLEREADMMGTQAAQRRSKPLKKQTSQPSGAGQASTPARDKAQTPPSIIQAKPVKQKGKAKTTKYTQKEKLFGGTKLVPEEVAVDLWMEDDGSGIYYHLTPKKNLLSIFDGGGLDPNFGGKGGGASKDPNVLKTSEAHIHFFNQVGSIQAAHGYAKLLKLRREDVAVIEFNLPAHTEFHADPDGYGNAVRTTSKIPLSQFTRLLIPDGQEQTNIIDGQDIDYIKQTFL
jgi:hypothetical protein